MAFTAPFIKIGTSFDPTDYAPAPAPIFRRRFSLAQTGVATVRFCAIGYGYCYINGKPITDDLLTAPVSDYDRLVWYHEYDVTALLRPGDNVVAVILGNGFLNENFPSGWDHNRASWRDHPKFAFSLTVGGETALESDGSFLCTSHSFVPYNQLRSGETFDARLYSPQWKEYDYDDSGFSPAVVDDRMDAVERRLCTCEPIRELETYDFVSARPTPDGYLLDFGVNIAGYVRIRAQEAPGTVIELRHAEEANPDGTLKLNRLDRFYPTVDFQTDRVICGDEAICWSPKFTYHGFRFVTVKGLSKPPQQGQIQAIFVHQAVEKKADFHCSDELMNKIFAAAVRSTYSNMHYALTDCPTREKLGWTNDAQASLDQIYMTFDAARFFEKWGTDIRLSVRPDGQLPAIVPSHGWGFGHGPVADGILFELPYKQYLYTGDRQMMAGFLPVQERYYRYFAEKGPEASGTWLGDWDGHDNRFKDMRFVHLYFTVRFCRIMLEEQRSLGLAPDRRYTDDRDAAARALATEYIDADGRSTVDSQTVIALLLSLDIVPPAPLVDQLARRIEKDGFHITSGMWGLQHIFTELARHGEAELACRLIAVKGKPSYAYWFDNGATSLWETWEDGHTDSRNHHMMSCVVGFFFTALLGMAPDIDHPGYSRVDLKPCFVSQLDFCSGRVKTPAGEITAAWKRTPAGTEYRVTVPHGMTVTFRGETLAEGENVLADTDVK